MASAGWNGDVDTVREKAGGKGQRAWGKGGRGYRLQVTRGEGSRSREQSRFDAFVVSFLVFIVLEW